MDSQAVKSHNADSMYVCCSHGIWRYRRQDAKHACVQAGEEVPSSISLVARRRDVPRVGEEVSINYGDKSNEELLLLYGAPFLSILSIVDRGQYF